MIWGTCSVSTEVKNLLTDMEDDVSCFYLSVLVSEALPKGSQGWLFPLLNYISLNEVISPSKETEVLGVTGYGAVEHSPLTFFFFFS